MVPCRADTPCSMRRLPPRRAASNLTARRTASGFVVALFPAMAFADLDEDEGENDRQGEEHHLEPQHHGPGAHLILFERLREGPWTTCGVVCGSAGEPDHKGRRGDHE